MIRTRPWIVTVPLIVLLGFASGWLSNSGYANYWFDQLRLPPFMPPDWAFPIAWTALYILMGVAVAQVIARDAPGRRAALATFVVQLALNLAWSPVFFGMHRIKAGLVIIVALVIAVTITIALFWRLRHMASLLLLPYLVWLLFATFLNYAILRLNL